MLIKLNSPYCTLCDGCHLRLRDRRLDLVKAGQLRVELFNRVHGEDVRPTFGASDLGGLGPRIDFEGFADKLEEVQRPG